MFDPNQSESKLREEVLRIRKETENHFPSLLAQVRVRNINEALTRAVEVVQSLLTSLSDTLDLNRSDPGHGAGHVIADYANSLRLFSRLAIDPCETFIGFLGGVTHDLGCALVKRYQENNRLVRHAEIGGLLADSLLKSHGLSDAERLLTAYTVCAHTHYLKPVTVGDQILTPYVDLFHDGTPIYAIWATRWVDRLDCNGPRFPARHYLTLVEEHEDFSGAHGFEVQNLEKALVPKTREEAGHVTMLSHLMMFCGSQNNASPYGKHDFGRMVELRDSYLNPLQHIIHAVQFRIASTGKPNDETVFKRWTQFLLNTAEPSEKGKMAAHALNDQFLRLPDDSKEAWACGFWQTMEEYKLWAFELLHDLETLPPDWMKLTIPGVARQADLRTLIQPHPSWAD